MISTMTPTFRPADQPLIARSMSQAGFWRRAFALAIDAAAVGAVLALAGLMLFQPTGGRVRIANVPFVNHTVCASIGVELRVTETASKRREVCASSLFGVVHDRWITTTDERSSGGIATSRSVSVPIDAEGRAVRAFYLDWLLVYLLVAYLVVAEWRFGTTLGKRALGLRVVSQDTGGALHFTAACRRLLRFLPVVPAALWIVLAMTIDPAGELAQSGGYWTAVLSLQVLSAALWLAILGNFVMAIIDEDLPWHDRWAGTDVVTTR